MYNRVLSTTTKELALAVTVRFEFYAQSNNLAKTPEAPEHEAKERKKICMELVLNSYSNLQNPTEMWITEY